ncbi:hypothetical protein [Marinospirillum sp.]|uniref:hypothetical protein n=1 Tax=Marinospirillum sp. TaxID=2183934 RepID=UPI00384F2A09
MKKLIALLAGLFSIGASASDYAIGQVWEYKTRESETGSHLYIVHIDDHEKIGKIYHIFVDGVAIKNPHIEGGVQDVLPHAPVDERTLELSLTKMVGTTKQLPDISEGYSIWKQAFDSGEGGVFNISVSQIIEYIEQMVGQNA